MVEKTKYQEYKHKWQEDNTILIITDKYVIVNNRSNVVHNKIRLERIIPIDKFNQVWNKRKNEYKLLNNQEIKQNIKSIKLNEKSLSLFTKAFRF